MFDEFDRGLTEEKQTAFSEQDKLQTKLTTMLFFLQSIFRSTYEDLLKQTFHSCDECFHCQ